MSAKSTIAILLMTIVAIPALGQDAPPWQVRPYLSTYTDDAARSGTETRTWNYTAIRDRFVCPYCGYSTPVEPAAGTVCPNPWGLANHDPGGAQERELTEATPRQRVLSHIEIAAQNIDGDPAAPLIGRPFHPGRATFGLAEWADPTATAPWEQTDPALIEAGDVASFLTARAGGNLTGVLTAPNFGLRFLVVKPGSVRAAARHRLLDSADAPTTDQFYRPEAATGADQYGIFINPYRVSDGDVWYIRHAETNVGGATTGVAIEVYSTLYGLNFDSNGAINMAQYDGDAGCRVITDDGAMMVDIPRRLAADGAGTWIIKLVIDSNTQTLPRPQEVNYDLWGAEGFTDIYAARQEPAIPLTGFEGTELSDIANAKQPFYIATDPTANPILSTADANDGVDYPVAEKVPTGGDPNFNTAEIWPYRMPPEAAGAGRVMLQWSPQTGTGSALSVAPMGGKQAYFRTGNEWHYLVDPTTPGTPLVTNADTAANNALPADVTFIESRFMCSRLEVLRTGDDWAGRDPAIPAESDAETATGGHTRIILGQYQDEPGLPVGWVGQYKPGSRTPGREFLLANRTPIRVLECPVDDDGCGARYPLGALQPGNDCPACNRGDLVLARAEAQVHYDAQDSMTAEVAEPAGTVYRRMATEALRFGASGAMVPIGAPDFLQEVFADVPAYQPPSVPAGPTGFFSNDLDNDWGYRGTMVAFNRPSDDGDSYDRNTDWDAYYVSPQTGRKFATPDAIDAALDTQAQWVCSVCGSTYNRGANRCRFCRHQFNTTDDLPSPRVPHDTLVAEEYDPFGVQISVLREPALAADQGVVDLGWVAPGVSATGAWPSDVSHRSELPLRNEGNIVTEAGMRASPLLLTGVDSAVRSYTRWGQTVPITLNTLFRYRPGPEAFGGTDWPLLRQDATGAAGELATALVQAGVRAATGEPYEGTIMPVPLGQPLGNYATEMLLFVDLDGNGQLDFYSPVYGATHSGNHQFNPDVDEPFEPVASFATLARVVESRLPFSDFYSRDLTPSLLYDADRESLQTLWVGQRAVSGGTAPAGTTAADVPLPTAPLNVLYANAAINDGTSAANDPLYRGWLWAAPPAGALSASTDANDSNTAPTAYIDEATGDRWAIWHRSLTTQAGVSSRLQFATSANDQWAANSDDYIFGSSGAHGALTGFVREGVANAHWMLWNAGPTGREHLRYRWEWDPTSGIVPSDQRLMVSNSSTGQRVDFFEIEDALGDIYRFRKPALDPFTYVKQASAWGSTNDLGEFLMDVVFTGHIRSLGNSDICWTRFNFGDPADVDDFPYNTVADNFGKVPFPRVVGLTYDDALTAQTDARGMPAARDITGAVRGYVGEQLEPSPRRQSFQARDIDWLVSYDFQTEPDWQLADWLTAGDPTAAYADPMFYVGVVTDDGTTLRQFVYAVEWSQGSYNPATGLYTVLPRLVRMTDTGLEELQDSPDPAIPSVWHPFDDSLNGAVYWQTINGVNAKALLAPSARGDALDADAWTDPANAEPWPAVTLTINPSSGMVQWSSSLFNPDNPDDRSAVFNAQNTPNLRDVVVYADYTPFIRRVTTDSADDDSPSAFWNQGDSGRMTVFWRRSYGDTDTPHFGRPSFMYRSYTRAVQVGRPEIGSITTVRDETLNEVLDVAAGQYQLRSATSGVIDIEPDPVTSLSRIGHRIAVTYQDADGATRTERHRVVGWSLETPVPINAVISEGPVRVTPEVYTVDPGGITPFETVRYWLTWSSPRGVYDLRPAAAGGQRVHQSSDVYLAVVAPEHSSLIADLEVPRLEP
ncbi:MAG: hypothetical protein ACOX9R_01095 [Armatimonadota bacterium]|jgi:hypothetical protein